MDAQQMEWLKTHKLTVGEYKPTAKMSWSGRYSYKAATEEELIRGWCEGAANPFLEYYQAGMDDCPLSPSQRRRRGRPRKF